MKKHRLAAITLLAFALGIPSMAAASPGRSDGADTIRIVYSDLNIYSDAGAKVLYGRLQRAAAKACGLDSYIRLGSLDRLAESKACYSETLDDLVARIKSDALRRIHLT